MEPTTRGCHFWLLVLMLLQLQQINAGDTKTEVPAAGNTVKKERPLSPPTNVEAETPAPQLPAQPKEQQQQQAAPASPEKPVEINKKPMQPPLSPPEQPKTQSPTGNGLLPVDSVPNEQGNHQNNLDFPDSYTPVYYVLIGITTSAILLFVARVYRLRLSRAERKYGVQGDRANQELTPLPMAIEDVNSDEDEDHTLFEVNRQSIRIL